MLVNIGFAVVVGSKMKKKKIQLIRKGTQIINSDLIQTLVIDRPNLRMNNREKIIGGDLLWRPTEAAKNPIVEHFEDIFT